MVKNGGPYRVLGLGLGCLGSAACILFKMYGEAILRVSQGELAPGGFPEALLEILYLGDVVRPLREGRILTRSLGE